MLPRQRMLLLSDEVSGPVGFRLCPDFSSRSQEISTEGQYREDFKTGIEAAWP